VKLSTREGHKDEQPDRQAVGPQLEKRAVLGLAGP